MRKILLSISIFAMIGFTVFQAGNRTTVAQSGQELSMMASVLEDEHIMINGWSLYARENMEDVKTNEDFARVVSGLKEKFPGWTWKEEGVAVTAKLNSSGRSERIKIIPTDMKGKVHTYIMYEVRGHSWDAQAENFVETKVNGRIFDIFRENAKVFACVKGETNDKMNKSLPILKNEMLKAFKAGELEGLDEKTFLSASAFSPLFDTSLTHEHKMNLQLGLRKTNDMGGKTTVVVGTPIITIEY
ncbi:YwmB family TATA-box binding protein [Bacillus massilinigeriensis]|uniref:YwmB family TATA-box binding protein n=1 Tax=Bacillus mediterraneensis TaxID=1805474 RepID=UPI0008F8A58F|nr:YwmB family TATA-box binding protein [Bacillus mediterraneensis]